MQQTHKDGNKNHKYKFGVVVTHWSQSKQIRKWGKNITSTNVWQSPVSIGMGDHLGSTPGAALYFGM